MQKSAVLHALPILPLSPLQHRESIHKLAVHTRAIQRYLCKGDKVSDGLIKTFMRLCVSMNNNFNLIELNSEEKSNVRQV